MKLTRPSTPSSAARARAEAMNTVLMSIPVPVTWWSRAQVHSISPLPQARSSIRVPGGGLSAWPKVASLPLVNGLWMRWLLSRMVKLRGRSTSGLLMRGYCPGCAGTGIANYLPAPAGCRCPGTPRTPRFESLHRVWGYRAVTSPEGKCWTCRGICLVLDTDLLAVDEQFDLEPINHLV